MKSKKKLEILVKNNNEIGIQRIAHRANSIVL